MNTTIIGTGIITIVITIEMDTTIVIITAPAPVPTIIPLHPERPTTATPITHILDPTWTLLPHVGPTMQHLSGNTKAHTKELRASATTYSTTVDITPTPTPSKTYPRYTTTSNRYIATSHPAGISIRVIKVTTLRKKDHKSNESWPRTYRSSQNYTLQVCRQ